MKHKKKFLAAIIIGLLVIASVPAAMFAAGYGRKQAMVLATAQVLAMWMPMVTVSATIRAAALAMATTWMQTVTACATIM